VAAERALREDVAVVTGASSGVGRAIALALASQGVSLHLVGRQPDRLAAVAADAARLGARVVRSVTDLTSDHGIDQLVDSVRRHRGGLDILAHSAGVFASGAVGADPVDLGEQYRTNLRAPYVLTGRLLPLFRPSAGTLAYAATKHALKGLADGLREEVNPRGIRVLSVFIGRAATPMQERIHRHEAKTYRPERLLQPEDVGRRCCTRCPCHGPRRSPTSRSVR
jgi:NAD(P)-dependent dehydrogenase (short-subunit alcohol dehydrogenase family)